MERPNESTHERLNRELARMRMRDAGFWGGWAVLIGCVGLFGFATLNTPTNVRYVEGIAGATMSMPTEDRIVVLTRVQVDGRSYDLRLPSQLVHPAVGDVLCLRAAQHRFTKHTSYVNVSPTLCADGPDTTPQVD